MRRVNDARGDRAMRGSGRKPETPGSRGGARAVWRVGALLAVAVGLAGCWGDEARRRFDDRYEKLCRTIEAYAEEGTEICDSLYDRRQSPDAWLACHQPYRRTEEQLLGVKADALQSFGYCSPEDLRRVWDDAAEVLRGVDRTLRSARGLYGLLSEAGESLGIDVRARLTSALRAAGDSGERLYAVSPGSRVEVVWDREGRIVDELDVEGTLRAAERPEGAHGSLEVTGIDLELRRRGGRGVPPLRVRLDEGPVSVALRPTGDEEELPRERHGRLEAVLAVRPGDLAEDVVRLVTEVVLSGDGSRLDLTTRGRRPSEEVLPGARPSGPHHLGFRLDGPLVRGRPATVKFHGLSAGAAYELYRARGLPRARTRRIEGAPWYLGADAERIAWGEADSTGHADILYWPDEDAGGQVEVFQALVRDEGGVRSTRLLADRVRTPFRRGDANADGRIDISDPVRILTWLFLGAVAPGCEAAADANGDGTVDGSDGVYLGTWLFLGAAEPPFPGPWTCGVERTGPGEMQAPACGEYPACR